jgi:hypothetical protein
MNIGYNHLIAKHGVLSAFSIAKKVSPTDIKKITDKIKNKNKSKIKSQEAFNQLLQEEIINSTKYSVTKESIPGIICDNKPTSDSAQYTMNNKKTLGLDILANEIAKKISQNKYSKDEICYLILNLLGILGLTDDDFREFHKKYNPNYDEDVDDEDVDDDDDEFNNLS